MKTFASMFAAILLSITVFFVKLRARFAFLWRHGIITRGTAFRWEVSVACLSILFALLAFAAPARADFYDQPNVMQAVAQSSITIQSTVVGTAMTQVDIALNTNTVARGSFRETVINMDTANAACCSFDSGAVNSAGAGRSCRQLDKYVSTAGVHDGSMWVISRWWQNLKLYCMTLGASTSEIRVTQER